MPTYYFYNKKKKKVEEHFMSMSSLDQFKIDHPNLEQQILSAPSFNYTGHGDFQSKTDNTWKEVMSKVAEAHPVSPLADKYGKKTTKELKTKAAIKKHQDRSKNAPPNA